MGVSLASHSWLGTSNPKATNTGRLLCSSYVFIGAHYATAGIKPSLNVHVFAYCGLQSIPVHGLCMFFTPQKWLMLWLQRDFGMLRVKRSENRHQKIDDAQIKGSNELALHNTWPQPRKSCWETRTWLFGFWEMITAALKRVYVRSWLCQLRFITLR